MIDKLKAYIKQNNSLLKYIYNLLNIQYDHTNRVTNKRTAGTVRNDIYINTVGKRVYLTGWLKWDTGQMPTRGDSAIYLGYIPTDLMPFNGNSVVFATHGQYSTDVNVNIRLVSGNRGIQFYNAGTGASGAEIFYYATWELSKIPSVVIGGAINKIASFFFRKEGEIL